MKDEIRFTKVNLPYGWMSNMSNHSVIFDGIEFPSAEHLFIWLRLKNKTKQKAKVFVEMKNPIAIKKYSKKMFKEGKWKLNHKMLSEDDVNIMELTTWYKLLSNPELAKELLYTDHKKIVEDVTNRASINNSSLYWGAAYICENKANVETKRIGLNMLGNIWMKHRTFLLQFIDGSGIDKLKMIMLHLTPNIDKRTNKFKYITTDK